MEQVTATIEGLGSAMNVSCGYRVGDASYTVATGDRTGSSTLPTSYAGSDEREIYVNAGTQVEFWGSHQHDGGGSAYAMSSFTESFSISKKV